MSRTLRLVLPLLGLALSAPAARAGDFINLGEAFVPAHAGMFEVRLRAVGVITQDRGSSVSTIGGKVETTNQAIPEIDLSYFIVDNLAVELIAGSSRHNIAATGTALGHVDVGSTWVLPPTLTLQYHLAPHSRVDPYIGAGVTAAFFYATKAAGGAVTSLGLKNTVSPAFQIGADIALGGHWVANVDVKQTLVQTTAKISDGALHAHTHLDPTLVGVGIGYRF